MPSSYVCPRCGTTDTDDTSIGDHGMCYNCHRLWQMGELDEEEVTEINNVDDLCAYFSCEGEPEALNDNVYESTNCGCSITLHYADGSTLNCGDEYAHHDYYDSTFTEHLEVPVYEVNWQHPGEPIKFTIHTIVEGSDAEFSRQLMFGKCPVSELETAIAEIEALAEEAWKRENEEDA